MISMAPLNMADNWVHASQPFQGPNVSQLCYVGPECAVVFALQLYKRSQDNLFVSSFKIYPVPSP